MRAMVLAAGLGTRLRPLTDDRPKALVEVAGHTMLERVLRRLQGFGVEQVIVNTHHFAAMVEDFLARHDNFGMQVEISQEPTLLDTGGGLKHASWFLSSGDADEPLLVHNVDVLSTIDLAQMMEQHIRSGALATLAVQDRQTSRRLVFDETGNLCGRYRADRQSTAMPTGQKIVAFTGIHVLSKRIFAQMSEQGAFPIIDTYLRLAQGGERIVAFDADRSYWRDLGRPESIKEAAKDLVQRDVPGY